MTPGNYINIWFLYYLFMYYGIFVSYILHLTLTVLKDNMIFV